MSKSHITFGNAFSDGPSVGVDVDSGTTVSQFLKSRGFSTEKAKVRVNREQVDGSRVLEDGDYLTLEPTNIKGG